MAGYQIQKSSVVQEIQTALIAKQLSNHCRVSLSFYIELSSEHDAKHIVLALEQEGFSADVDAFQQEEGIWRCWCNIAVEPSDSDLAWLESVLMLLCTKYGGTLKSCETNQFASGQELGLILAKFERQYRQHT